MHHAELCSFLYKQRTYNHLQKSCIQVVYTSLDAQRLWSDSIPWNHLANCRNWSGSSDSGSLRPPLVALGFTIIPCEWEVILPCFMFRLICSLFLGPESGRASCTFLPGDIVSHRFYRVPSPHTTRNSRTKPRVRRKPVPLASVPRAWRKMGKTTERLGGFG